jgi:hypothetical protein
VITSLFLFICKVNTRPIIFMLYMALFLVVFNVGLSSLFFGNNYMIAKFKIDISNLIMLILSHVFVPQKKNNTYVILWSFYSFNVYLNIVKYKNIISMYSMCMNGYASRNFNKKNLLYIYMIIHTHLWEHFKVHK